MKSNKNSFFRGISMLLIIFALTFSTNAKANSPVASSALSNIVATSVVVKIVPAKMYSLTGGFLSGIKDWFRNRKRNRRTHTHYRGCGHGDSSQGGSDDHHGNGGDAVPLDGGLGILALGAAAFGVRKLRGNKHDKI
jgi:hypothetical protein